MTKIQINRDTENAIKSTLATYSKDQILAQKSAGADNSPITNLTVGELATALYVGYEVEVTPDEHVFDYYVQASEESRSSDTEVSKVGLGKVDAIKNILNKLGVSITGINAGA